MGTILPSTSGAMISSALGMLASFIPYEKRVYDVSSCGTYMTLKVRGINDYKTYFFSDNADGMITIEHFADDKQPFKLENYKRKTTSTSFNGNLIFSNEAPLLKISISVIPNTKEDSALNNIFNMFLWEENVVVDLCVSQERLAQTASNARWPLGDKAKSEVVNVGLYGGVIESGPPGTRGFGDATGLLFSSTQDGRNESHTYDLVFSPNSMYSIDTWASEPQRKGFLQSIKDTFTKG